MAKKNIMTPKGIASYPHLNKPDTKFDDKGVYKLDLIVEKGPEAEALVQVMKDLAIEDFGKKAANAHLPVSEYAEDDTKLLFRLRGQYKPVLRDARGTELRNPPQVGGGTVCKASATAKTYNAGGKTGVKLYLNQVQLIQLVEFGGNPFGEEEGWTAADQEEADNEPMFGDESGEGDEAPQAGSYGF